MGFDDIYRSGRHLTGLGFGRDNLGLGGLARDQLAWERAGKTLEKLTTLGLANAVNPLALGAGLADIERVSDTIRLFDVQGGIGRAVDTALTMNSIKTAWSDRYLGIIGKHFESVGILDGFMKTDLGVVGAAMRAARPSTSVFEEIVTRQNALLRSPVQSDDLADWRRFWSAHSTAVRELARREPVTLPGTLANRRDFLESEVYEGLAADVDSLDIDALLEELLGGEEVAGEVQTEPDASPEEQQSLRLSTVRLRVVAFAAAGAGALTAVERTDAEWARWIGDFRDNFTWLLAASFAVLLIKDRRAS